MVRLIFLLTIFMGVTAQANEPVLSCKHVPVIQKGFLSQHIKYKTYDSALEKKLIEQYIKRLDPSKLYLTTGDVKEIEGLMKGIHMRTQQNDCSPIMKAQDIFAKRLEQRGEFVKKFLDDKYKFNKNVKINLDSEKRPRLSSVEKINDFHKDYIHFQISNYLASDIKLEDAKKKVIKNYQRITKKIKGLTEDEKLSDYLDVFAHALDPHSSFFSREAMDNFKIQMELSLEGIGATLKWEDGFTVVESLVEGGAAATSGEVKPKDKIIAVSQGENKPVEDVIDMELNDVVKKIRGKSGTPVHLTILRKEGDTTKRLVVKLKRSKINLEDEAASITYHTRKIGDQEKLIGLINLPSFYSDGRRNGRSAASDVTKLIGEANKKGVQALVLDLSNNGGGSLDDAVRISGLFFKTGNVVKQSSSDPAKPATILADINPMVNFSGPLVVLTSRISASASEIVSGVLQDYKRAVIVGADHTFGKGTVQSVVPLSTIGALKVTVGMFFTSGGYSTQHRGVISDIAFPSVLATDEIGEKTYDYSLPPKRLDSFISSSAFVHKGSGQWTILDKKVLAQLQKASEKRIKANEKFKEILSDLAKNKERGKIINLAEVMKEKEEDHKKEEAEKALTKEDKLKKYTERPEVQEAINIATDLVALQTKVPLTMVPSSAPQASNDKIKKDEKLKN